MIAWTSNSSDKPAAAVAQPGIAHGVASRTTTDAASPPNPSNPRPTARTSRRTPTTSLNTAIALSPWTTSATKFIEERPRSRAARSVGIVQIGCRDR